MKLHGIGVVEVFLHVLKGHPYELTAGAACDARDSLHGKKNYFFIKNVLNLIHVILCMIKKTCSL